MRRLSKQEVGKLRLQGKIKTPLKAVPKPEPEPEQKIETAKTDPVAAAIRQSAIVTERALGMIKDVLVQVKNAPRAPERAPREWRFTVTDRDRRGDIKTISAKEI